MVKQRLERTIKGILSNIPYSYHMKLQVNPNAHTKTVGDFLFTTNKANMIIECKECNGTNFPISRFTQKEMMKKFHDSLIRNVGIIIISFWKGSKKKSAYYVLYYPEIEYEINRMTKKSFNEDDLSDYRHSYDELKHLFEQV